jgi:hypothetical protein
MQFAILSDMSSKAVGFHDYLFGAIVKQGQ